MEERYPAGRFGEPEDIVGSVVCLASRAADYGSPIRAADVNVEFSHNADIQHPLEIKHAICVRSFRAMPSFHVVPASRGVTRARAARSPRCRFGKIKNIIPNGLVVPSMAEMPTVETLDRRPADAPPRELTSVVIS